jgi:hypothetical protein
LSLSLSLSFPLLCEEGALRCSRKMDRYLSHSATGEVGQRRLVFDLPRRDEFCKVAFHLFDSSRRPLLDEEGTNKRLAPNASTKWLLTQRNTRHAKNFAGSSDYRRLRCAA